MKHCIQQELDPITLPVAQVLAFLQDLRTSRKNETVKGWLTAISRRHCKVVFEGKMVALTELPVVHKWTRGLLVRYPPIKTRVPPWSLEVVLSALKKPPFYYPDERSPFGDVSLKFMTFRTVFLLALTSARRVSEIHAIQHDTLIWRSTGVTALVNEDFLPKVASEWHCNRPIQLPSMEKEKDNELKKLCVRRTLLAYINKTKVIRKLKGTRQLFLCYGKSVQGSPVSKQRISTWLKEVVQECYKLMGLPPPEKVKGHDVRKTATSWADMAGVPSQEICDAATWSSDCTFSKFYKLDLHHQGSSRFGRSVLHKSASSSEEKTLRCHLGRPTVPFSTITSLEKMENS